MRLRNLLLLTTLGGLLLTATVTAEPPSGSTCVSGYNPSALTNVCYKNNPGTTVNVPSVDTSDELCVIGDICAPFVSVGPSRPQHVPGGVAPSYITVGGAVVYDSDMSLQDTVVEAVEDVGQNAVDCVSTPVTPVATWARDYADCVRDGV